MAQFAVVRTGGKMYRVAPGQVLVVERVSGEGEFTLGDVLMVSDEQGTLFCRGEQGSPSHGKSADSSPGTGCEDYRVQEEKAQELQAKAGSQARRFPDSDS